jgi:CheY-like chemotaxis protein
MQTILVVDDDPILRVHISELLQDAGYQVLEASNTDEALAVLEQHSNIKLLFTDVQMPPGADGIALAEIVQNRWPDVSVLVTSGGLNLSDDDIPDGGEFVSKPYSRKLLLSRIERMIANNISAA